MSVLRKVRRLAVNVVAFLLALLATYSAPGWSACPPHRRVEVKLNDSVTKVLHAAPGWNPPTLQFEFVDSAINLSARDHPNNSLD